MSQDDTRKRSSAKRSVGRPPEPDVLTRAEWRVVEAVRHGLGNRAIAERQGVSADAIKFHLSNILGKLQLRSRRELRRWCGIAAASHLAQSLTSTESRMDNAAAMHEPASGKEKSGTPKIGQIARDTADLDASITFYRDRLGLPLLMKFPGMAFFDCQGVRLMISAGSATPQSILYFQVDNISARYQALLSSGITGLSAPHLIHRHDDGREEWMAFFQDPDQRPVALMAQVLPRA